MKVVIIGGGYAGLAAVVTLRRQAAAVEITVIDPRDAHLKITRLHQTLRQPLAQQRVPFADLAEKFDFRFIQAAPETGGDALNRYQRDRQITLNGSSHGFDYMLVAKGAPGVMPDRPGEHCYGLDQLTQTPGRAVVDEFVRRTRDTPLRAVTVVGAGATGIQFTFELIEALRERTSAHIRLVDADARVLPQLPESFDSYTRQRLTAAGVEFLPNCEFCRQEANRVMIKSTAGEEFQLPSQLSLLFLGRKPQPERLQANRYGQLMHGDRPLESLFAAGDCASFAGDGLDKLTAQAAIRKAKHAAENIVRSWRSQPLEPYDYRELGYVVSLGSYDAVGWLGGQQAVVKGVAAAGVKTAIEGQYDLLLKGVDTYFDVSALRAKLGDRRSA